MRHLAVLLAAVASLLIPTIVLGQSPTKIADVISAGHVLLLEEKGKSSLKFVTSSGGTAEMERVK